MGRDTRDYSNPDEIHMEPGELHDPTNTVPPLPAELDQALAQVARQNRAALGGTGYQIAMGRVEREGFVRQPQGSGVNIDPARDEGPSVSHRSPRRGRSLQEQGGAGDAG